MRRVSRGHCCGTGGFRLAVIGLIKTAQGDLRRALFTVSVCFTGSAGKWLLSLAGNGDRRDPGPGDLHLVVGDRSDRGSELS